MTETTIEIIGIWVSALGTLGIMSLIFKENPVYRFFEHVFVGASVGYGFVLGWTQALDPKWWVPFSEGVGEVAAGLWDSDALLIFPFLFGAFYYTIYSKKWSWLARLVIAFNLGAGATAAIKGFFASEMPQITASFKNLTLYDPNGILGFLDGQGISNLVFVASLLCVLTYFFFIFEHNRPGIKQASITGRWLLMISFGTIFGSTIMGRLALLIERVQFLVRDWLGLA